MKGQSIFVHKDVCAPSKVAVVGAGVAGCEAALALTQAGFTVDLYDQNSEILQGSSNASHACLNTGPHYPDIETVKKLMNDVEVFLRVYQSLDGICIKNDDGSIRTRLYVVPQGVKILRNGCSVAQHFQNINVHWKKYRGTFPCLQKIGGLPEDIFAQQLTDADLNTLKRKGLLSDDISLAFRTREPFLNVRVYRNHLRTQLESTNDISLKLSTSVSTLSESVNPYPTASVVLLDPKDKDQVNVSQL